MDKQDAWAEIKPYTKSLTPSDVDACVKLEDATFPPQERATKEKFLYRFTRCGEINLGLFTSARTDDSHDPVADKAVPTVAAAKPVTSDDPERKLVLLAHCVATKSTNDTILDEDMEVPSNWESSSKASSVGHNDAGRTVCIHSLAVLPAYQGKGLGSTLMKAFIQRIEHAQAADRIALLAHGQLTGFYQSLGFVNKGPSKAQFGGGGWVDMVYEIQTESMSREALYKPSFATQNGPVSETPAESPGGHLHPPKRSGRRCSSPATGSSATQGNR